VREFLREILKAAAALRKTVVERVAEQGFSFGQLWRAQAIKGRSFKQDKEWFWALPEHVPAEENEQETDAKR
jgi:hypothetical protein